MASPPAIPGAILVTNLTGSELVAIGTVGPQSAQTTTGDIAALAATESTEIVFTALNTVGAGTITAAGIVGGITARGGTQVATFSDTTDTAANIIAALPSGAPIGTSFFWNYQNTTNYPATIGAGANVTLTGSGVVPAKSTARFLVTVTSATAVSIQIVDHTFATQNSGTFTMNGATPVTVANTAVTPESNILITLKTVGGTVGAHPAIQTITSGTGFTVAGTALDTSVYNYLILG